MTLTAFHTYFSKGERRKYTEKEVGFNRVSNSQPPGHDDTLTTEPLRRGTRVLEFNAASLEVFRIVLLQYFQCFDFRLEYLLFLVCFPNISHFFIIFFFSSSYTKETFFSKMNSVFRQNC